MFRFREDNLKAKLKSTGRSSCPFAVKYMKTNLISFALLLILVFGLGACKEDPPVDDTFNRNAFLEHMADELILPGFRSLNQEMEQLEARLESFVNNPDSGQLALARQHWWQTYQAWLKVNSFNVGPAAESGLRKSLAEEIGTFPVNSAGIESRIASGDTSTQNFLRDTRGFLSIEYLLFHESPAMVVEGFKASNRKNYLLSVSRHCRNRIAQVRNEWESDYRSEFLSSNGSDAGSSVSQLYNAFVMSFENIKNFKLGIPLGLRPGQVTTEPDKSECVYSGKGIEAMILHLRSIIAIYEGNPHSGNVSPNGFKHYLQQVYGGSELVDKTIPSYTQILAQMEGLDKNTPLDQHIRNNPQPLIEIHNALQQHTRFFKSDMSSLLGIAITYSSGDGD